MRSLKWSEAVHPVRRPAFAAGVVPLRRGLRIAAALLVLPMLSVTPNVHADPADPAFEEHCPEPDPNCWSDQSRYHAFYTPPNPLPGQPGALIRSEAQDGIRLEPSGQLGSWVAHATRIMYVSTDARHNPVAETGTYLEPNDPWPGPGPRPLIAYAASPLGLGDHCAESRLLDQGVHFSSGQDLMLNLDEGFLATMVARGFAVVVSDGTGVGTPGPVPFLIRDASGPPLLDAARAAMQLPGTSLHPHGPVALWGWSANGGQASADAAEIAADYAPDLNVVGAWSGAPAADPTLLPPFVDGNVFLVALGWVLNGVLAAYPEAAPVLAPTLAPRGQDLVSRSASMCLVEGLWDFGFRHLVPWDQFLGHGYFNTDPYQLFSSDPVHSILAAQRLGTRKPAVPVMLESNRWDPFMPWGGVRQLAQDWCDKGADVQLWTNYQTPFFEKMAIFNHVLPWWVDGERSMAWIADRFNGQPTTPNCQEIPNIQ
nr:lipase family protein [Mycobacterium paraffinicum]